MSRRGVALTLSTALHDGKVDRTTDGTGSVYEKTLAEVQALDAAYEFVPGKGTKAGESESAYVFRGVRTGAKAPPAGFRADDFRIPELEEVLRTYPDIPINIEIKGAADADIDSFMRNAELLAAELKRIGRVDGVIVASFNDAALRRFHELAPEVGLAPATGAVAAWKAANAPLPEGSVAFQVPITFGGVSVTDREFVERAHAQGYAVHVWLSGQREAPDVYEQLLDWGVDGIMAAEPTSLEGVLCRRGAARPSTPGVTHCPAATVVSGGCAAKPARLSRAGPRGVVLLRVRRLGSRGACRGTVRLRRAGARTRALTPRRRFAIPDGRTGVRVRLRLSRRGRAVAARRARVPVVAVVRHEGARPATRRFLLRRR